MTLPFFLQLLSLAFERKERARKGRKTKKTLLRAWHRQTFQIQNIKWGRDYVISVTQKQPMREGESVSILNSTPTTTMFANFSKGVLSLANPDFRKSCDSSSKLLGP